MLILKVCHCPEGIIVTSDTLSTLIHVPSRTIDFPVEFFIVTSKAISPADTHLSNEKELVDSSMNKWNLPESALNSAAESAEVTRTKDRLVGVSSCVSRRPLMLTLAPGPATTILPAAFQF